MNDHLKILITKFQRRLYYFRDREGNKKANELAGKGYNLPSGHKRIYFHHIPKAAGSSLKISLLSAGGDDGKEISKVARQNSQRRTFYGDKVYLYFNHYLIEQGYYYFAHSHFPSHYVNLPGDTFTITCFRDPVARIVSLYGMMERIKKIKHTKSFKNWINRQLSWLGPNLKSQEATDIVGFAQSLPTRFLLNQLYMFSPNLEVEEAVNKVENVDHVIYVEDYNRGVADLGTKLGLNLEVKHANQGASACSLPSEQLSKLREMLAPEYAFLAALHQSRGGYSYSS